MVLTPVKPGSESLPPSAQSCQRYEIGLIDSEDALRAAQPDWYDFIGTDVSGRTLHNDPAYIEARLASSPDLKLKIIVVRRDGHIKCIAPFYIQCTALPLRLSVITLASLPIRLLKVF